MFLLSPASLSYATACLPHSTSHLLAHTTATIKPTNLPDTTNAWILPDGGTPPSVPARRCMFNIIRSALGERLAILQRPAATSRFEQGPPDNFPPLSIPLRLQTGSTTMTTAYENFSPL